MEGMDWITITITAVATLILLWFIWVTLTDKAEKASNESGLDPEDADSSVCQSPTCARCQSRAYDASSVKQQLMKSFTAYIMDDKISFNSDFAQQQTANQLPRVLCTINSIDNKVDILRATYHESGYEFDSCESQPHIWWMPDLKRLAFWDASDYLELQKIATVFESSETLELLQLDYMNARTKPLLWKENKIPTGKWRVFRFYDQGSRVTANCSICPHTTAILDSISDLMTGCIYGNAMISVLEPGSEIEAHTGPCNFRLRCHLALFENKKCMIQVGTEVRSWERGKLMVFDDSFVHRVWYESGEGGDKNRVVLIFDVWHPDVQQDERHSLNYLFHSGHSLN